MNCHYLGNPQTTYKIAILIKDSYFNPDKLNQFYFNPLINFGFKQEDIIAFDLPYPEKKITTGKARKHFENLLPALSKLAINTLYVTDVTYFKALTKLTKADNQYNAVNKCALKGYEHISIILGVNYGQLLYNPNLCSRLDLSLETVKQYLNGTYKPLEHSLTLSKPNTYQEIKDSLYRLLQAPTLACDIETFGLKLKNAGLASIAFAIDEHNAVAFKVDNQVRKYLKLFFEMYKGKLIFHNASFDIKNIIFTCFMEHPLDYKGMLHGLHTMCKNIHDTKIIAYLATNSTTGNELGLKTLSSYFMGDYAEDVSDITQLDDETLLTYNAKDTCATWFVFKQYYPKMLQDNQAQIYNDLMLPSLKVIIQMELCGMPMDKNQLDKVTNELQQLYDKTLQEINQHEYIEVVTHQLKLKELAKINAKLKTKQHTLDYLSDFSFNPNSNPQLQFLLYTWLKLPVLNYTASKQPATDSDTLFKLLNHTQDERTEQLLTKLIELNKVSKILSTFIPAFHDGFSKANGLYLHGNFNLGGTLSGRLSSNSPNLQQLPSGSEYGKLIKSCFKAPKGWLMVGSDYASLEDRINALLTKDRNKIKVYTDGYDGHSLRAISYFNLPIDSNDVKLVNEVKNTHPKERQASKPITFALTYGGTYHTLMTNCGFTEQEAKSIEANYHNLYEESDKWQQEKLKQCERDGYIDVAFGLRIRTPLLKQTVLGNSKTLREAQNEARSVANAFSGQSYGLLTNRAINEFMQRVWQSEYKYDILPISLIHDAIYLMVKNDVRIVKWVNDNLIECMRWQELEELKHDQVHLESELSIFYPSWAEEICLPNHSTEQQIKALCKK